ncbi:MAG: response regulator [Rhodocyclaceae bacterium]|nr:response regulator [Rhodocyclaceae bacterium]MBX3669305.1 response regulator [Rhodocyclaceae bacterium]
MDSGFSVLVVDDDVRQSAPLIALLRAAGATDAYSAENAAAALNLLKSGTAVDLVVTDLELSGASGYELMEALGEIENAPLVAIVSGASAADLDDAMVLAQAYGVKPLLALRKPVLAAEIETLLDLYRARRAAS